jgi:hypothetical protein
MFRIEIHDLIENDICDERFRADSGGVIKSFPFKLVGVVAEDLALACGGADLWFDPEHDGNILIRMQAI